MDVQHLFLSGRATRDAETHQSKQGKPFVKFGIACNRYLGKERGSEPTYFDCLIFGKQAEGIGDKIKKGDKLLIHGRPEVDAYLSKEGEAKAQLNVVVEDWQVMK